MIYLEGYPILARLVCELIKRNIYQFSEDSFAKFDYAFLLKACEYDRIFLRISRETLIQFADENSEFVRFRRDLNVLEIFKPKKEAAVSYFDKKYSKNFNDYKLPNADSIIDVAITYALS